MEDEQFLNVKLYVIANERGEFLKRTSYYGAYYGKIEDARIYRKLGTAKGIVTRLNKGSIGRGEVLNHYICQLNVNSITRI